MILKIAFRNLWRNSRRTLIVILSIAVGAFAIILYNSFTSGMVEEMMQTRLNFEHAHIEINKKGYHTDKKVDNYISDQKRIISRLDTTAFVKHYAGRTMSFGLLSTANGSAGITINGIDPIKEQNITKLHKVIAEGKYLSGEKRQILISEKTAERLNAELGDRIVAVVNDARGNVINELFLVSGIFRSSSSTYDKMNAFINLDASQEMLGLGDKLHQIAVITDDYHDILPKDKALEKALPDDVEVLSYRELMPLMISYVDSFQQSLAIFYFIIAFAALFGIINSMLMSIFERVQEFGVLMSLGMKRRKIFSMVMLESLFIGIIGLIGGFVITAPVLYLFDRYGLDLSAFSDGLSSFGMGNVIYPVFGIETAMAAAISLLLAAVAGAIYPALKAVKLQPTDAMRYV